MNIGFDSHDLKVRFLTVPVQHFMSCKVQILTRSIK